MPYVMQQINDTLNCRMHVAVKLFFFHRKSVVLDTQLEKSPPLTATACHFMNK